MTSQVFYRKWRPQILAEVVGQEQVTQTLLNALASERVSHAYLFCGPRGTGKTSTGRILAKAINCLTSQGKGEPCNACPICQSITEGGALDVIEIDAASNTGVEDIRSLREKVNYAPNQARYKVYIIDEVHMLSTSAANALLKTLEEPPPHAIFVLATTEAHKLLPTIMSRCQRFDFRRISQADMVAKLDQICSAEGIHIVPEALRLVARAATGSLRDAENMLQQMTTYYGTEIELQQVQNILGITGDWRSKELVRHIINNDISAGITTINSVNHDGLDLRQFNRELVAYLRALLLIKTGSDESVDLTAEDIKELKELATKASLPQVLTAVKLFGQLNLDLDNYSILPMELALVDCTLPMTEKREEPVAPVEAKQPEKRSIDSVVTPPAPAPREKPVTTSEPPAAPEPAATYTPATAVTADSADSLPPQDNVTEPESEPAEPGSEIERLVQNWRQVIRQAPGGISRTPAAALLRSATPKAIEDNTIVLSFKYPVHKENMEKVDNQKIAEKIIGNFLGRSCRVRCVYEPDDNHLVQAALKMGAKIINTEEK